MDIQSIFAQLRQELEQIDKAIAALVGLGSQPARRGRPPKVSQVKPASGRTSSHERGGASQDRSGKESMVGKAEGQAPKKAAPVSKSRQAAADESSHAEEVVGNDEGQMGGAKEGGIEC